MNWAFELLGLPSDADVPSVKRAYAKLLRTTRPDDDPAAFQRLHTAYKMVLAHASKQASPLSPPVIPAIDHGNTIEQRITTETIEQSPLAAPASQVQVKAVEVVHPTIHPGALANETIRIAVEAESRAFLLQWLEKRPEFWSIQVKQQTGQLMLGRLLQHPQPMHPEYLDALLRFFDLDHVLSGVNPFALQQLRRRQLMQWEMIPQNHYALAQRIHLLRDGRADVASVRKYLATLQQPLDWRAVLRTTLQRGGVRNAGRFLQALCHGRMDELPASFDRPQALFWFRAAASGAMTWPRFIIGTLRVGLIVLTCTLIIAAIFTINATVGDMPGMDAARFGLTISATIAASLLGLWLLYAGGIGFDHWQGLPESTPLRRPWLRRLAIPVLCIIGVGMYEAGIPYFAAPLVLVSFVFAVRRFRRRMPQRGPKSPLRIGSMMPAIAFIGIAVANALSNMHGDIDFPFIPAAAVAAFGTWSADMWRHRAHLKLKSTHR